MAKKRKKTTLPRLTLLAYSRQDLLAFTASVEALRCLVGDLQVLVEDLGRKARKPRPVHGPVFDPQQQPAAAAAAAAPDRVTDPTGGA